MCVVLQRRELWKSSCVWLLATVPLLVLDSLGFVLDSRGERKEGKGSWTRLNPQSVASELEVRS